MILDGRDESDFIIDAIRRLHDDLRDDVIAACEAAAGDELARVARDRDDEGDTLYAIDRVGEERLAAGFTALADRWPLVLVAEGLPGGELVLPLGVPRERARLRVIVDPIDGTRCLMFQKRSAWILTGVALDRGDSTALSDIDIAVETEIPLVVQHLSDQFWARRGSGARGERFDRLSGRRKPLPFAPSTASSLAHGFASVTRFVPGARDVLAAIDDAICNGVLGPARPDRALVFEDQYLSTGGQLVGLMTGKDRFVAELRAWLGPVERARGLPMTMRCHAYDLAAVLIAQEAGVVVTSPDGKELDARLGVDVAVAWTGYANPAIRDVVAPIYERRSSNTVWRRLSSTVRTTAC